VNVSFRLGCRDTSQSIWRRKKIACKGFRGCRNLHHIECAVLNAYQDDAAREQRRTKQPRGAEFVNRNAEKAEMVEHDRPAQICVANLLQHDAHTSRMGKASFIITKLRRRRSDRFRLRIGSR